MFYKIVLIKGVYCYFCQLALLNISLSVEAADGSQCNSLFFSSVIANMATIFLNFQQKFALVRRFQHFAIKVLNQKDFSCLKSASRSSLIWGEKCEVFLLELLSAIARSNLARKNDVTDFARFHIHVQK